MDLSNCFPKFESEKERIILNTMNTYELKDVIQITIDNPEMAVIDILSELLQTIKINELNEENVAMLKLREDVGFVLKRTAMLEHINIAHLTNNDQICSFLINLNNLIYIHAKILQISQFGNSWLKTQFENFAIGYNIGQFGFISLYDIQSTLLNYPNPIKSHKASLFKNDVISIDPNVIFALASDYPCSPKIEIVHAENLNSELKNLRNEYVRWCLENGYLEPKRIPMIIIIYIEFVAFFEKQSNKLFQISEESDEFIEINDQYISTLAGDTSSSVLRITYTNYYDNNDQMEGKLWITCETHKSVFECLKNHSYIIQDAFGFLKSAACAYTILLYLSKTLSTIKQLNDPPLDSCVQSLMTFLSLPGHEDVEESLKEELMEEEYGTAARIIGKYSERVSSHHICDKIQICRKISRENILSNSIEWFEIFDADAAGVLHACISSKNAILAFHWVTIQFNFHPTYQFPLQIFGSYLLSLTEEEDSSFLDLTIERLNENQISDLCDEMLKMQNIDFRNLIKLLKSINKSDNIENTKQKISDLLLGLRMIVLIPSNEQNLYMNLICKPIFVMEQLLMMKKLELIQEIIKETYKENSENWINVTIKSRIDELLRVYAGKALSLRKEGNKAVLELEDADEKFVPPLSPPTTQQWIPDNEVNCCECCKIIEFGVFTRRHHCRRCGRVVCSSCSKQRSIVQGYNELVRICDQCYKYKQQYNIKDEVCANISNEEIPKLTIDEEYNKLLRKQFTYDNIPSVSLCLSILELHSQDIAVPRYLFINSERLLRILNNGITGYDKEEITKIIKSLLLASKMYYSHLGLPCDVERCEELSAEVDLLHRLSTHGVSSMYSTKPVRDIEQLIRIRQRLIQQHHWNLALEISTKTGMDSAGIWFVWGIWCLKNKDWKNAREKMSRSSLEKNTSLLKDVLQVLCEEEKEEVKENIDEKVYNECLYYIQVYGSDKDLLEFYIKRKQLKKALSLIINENMPPAVFRDKLYIPALKEGTTNDLHKAMQDIDNTLQVWKEYIRLICVYCDGNNYLKVLYSIQILTNDYVRAAMTSIQFHLYAANTYYQLHVNMQHLDNAYQHLEDALKCYTNSNFNTQKNGIIMVLKPDEIEKHLNTIYLQKEATSIIINDTASTRVAHKFFKTLPTLFGTIEEKVQVIQMVFQSSSDVKCAFTFSHRLVLEYGVNAIKVYPSAAKWYLENNRDNDVDVLLRCLQERIPDTDKLIDDVIVYALKADTANSEKLIMSIKDSNTRIQMYIKKGLLKSAYLLAARENKFEWLEEIAKQAEKLKQVGIKRICLQKLAMRN